MRRGLLLLVAVSAFATPVEKVLWRPPGNIEKLDFTAGPGGRARAPRPPFTFIDEDKSGTNPKLLVRDGTGARWTVKFGPEVKAEVFASRLAWASGYFAEPVYFVRSGRIRGVRETARVDKYVDGRGRFREARFELRDHIGQFRNDIDWTWKKNPFVGSHELNGLKILVMLTSNWDNKDGRDITSNTGIVEQRFGGRNRWIYFITDWGASMGQWGGFFTREKWDCSEYSEQSRDFVKDIEDDGEIRWGYKGKHDDAFKEDITPADVRWLMQYVGRITDKQLRDGLRAAGAAPHEVNCFSRAVRARIQTLRRVARADMPSQFRARRPD